MPFVMALALGLVLQAGFVVLDCKDAPYRAAVDFTRAYFSLDPAMADQLCKGPDTVQQTTVVSRFIEQSIRDTAESGFGPEMAKSAIYHVKTNTVQKNDQEAEVHLTAYRRTAINPVFLFTAKLFDLGRTYHVEETIKMVKEDGRWKVCGPVFDLAADS